MFATTRDVWATQQTNAVLERLDRDLAAARDCWTPEKPSGPQVMLWAGLALQVAATDLEKLDRFVVAGQGVAR